MSGVNVQLLAEADERRRRNAALQSKTDLDVREVVVFIVKNFGYFRVNEERRELQYRQKYSTLPTFLWESC